MAKQLTGVIAPAPVPWKLPPAPVERDPGGASSTSTVAATVTNTSGILPLVWTYTNLAASQTALIGTWEVVGQVGVQMLFSGSIVGIAYRSNAAKTAGTATFWPYIDATVQTNGLSWTDNLTMDYLTFPEGQVPFAAGEELDVRVTTSSSYAPATSEVGVLLYVTFSPS